MLCGPGNAYGRLLTFLVLECPDGSSLPPLPEVVARLRRVDQAVLLGERMVVALPETDRHGVDATFSPAR